MPPLLGGERTRRRRSQRRIEIDGRRKRDRDAAKHVGFELERGVRGATKRERQTKIKTRENLCQKSG